MKPLEPSLHWVGTFVRPGERVVVPCAGTAPTAIAAERVYDDVDVLAVECDTHDGSYGKSIPTLCGNDC